MQQEVYTVGERLNDININKVIVSVAAERPILQHHTEASRVEDPTSLYCRSAAFAMKKSHQG